jgi:hypothetical protein
MKTTLADSYSHAEKQLQFSLDFVSGRGDLREKLCEAFKNHLLLLRLDDFPLELRQDFAALINEFCRSGIQKYGVNCERSSYLISESQSIDLIGKIIALHIQLITFDDPQSTGDDMSY